MLNNYIKLENGVIKQDIVNVINYDENYIKTYNNLGELSMRMSYLRYSFIVSALDYVPTSILDIGYGNGDFLKTCSGIIPKCYGSDISGYDIPDNCEFIMFNDIFQKEFDVITFFDSLEHFSDINFVKDLNCNFVVISVPECHYISDDWFKNWKHRKENEHLYHFNRASLSKFMSEQGFILEKVSNIEDIIRKPYDDNLSNILTCIFKKNIW